MLLPLFRLLCSHQWFQLFRDRVVFLHRSWPDGGLTHFLKDSQTAFRVEEVFEEFDSPFLMGCTFGYGQPIDDGTTLMRTAIPATVWKTMIGRSITASMVAFQRKVCLART